jgi:hypothetical protein
MIYFNFYSFATEAFSLNTEIKYAFHSCFQRTQELGNAKIQAYDLNFKSLNFQIFMNKYLLAWYIYVCAFYRKKIKYDFDLPSE